MKNRLVIISALLLGTSVFGTLAQAETCPVLSNGDLFKIPKQSAVYLVNDRNERMYFPNSEVFFTWFNDFKTVREISPLCMENYPLAGGVNYRAGSRLVKTSYSNNVYAIEPGNIRRKLASAEVASALYGPNWEKSVRVIHENFMLNLTTGEPLTTSSLHNGQLVRTADNPTVYWVRRNALVPIKELPPTLQADVRTVDSKILQTKTIESTATTYGAFSQYDPGQKTATINWQVRMYKKVYEVLDFINGLGADKAPAVTTITGQGDTLYVMYRADKTGYTDWNVKEGASHEDLVMFLNGTGTYEERQPVDQAMFVDRDRLYVFYRGENPNARWAYAPTNGLDGLHNFINGLNGNPVARVGSLNGKTEKSPVMYYRQDLVGTGKWGWKKVTNNDITDLRQFLNGLGVYGNPVIDAQAIHNGEDFFIFYRK